MGAIEGAVPTEQRRHLSVLPESECLTLVRTSHIGRVAVTRPGLGPLVVPVSYEVDDEGRILFRSGLGTKIDALMAARVSFQVDDVDTTHGTGWSVLIEGTASVRWASETDPNPAWAPVDLPFLVSLSAEHVTGRWLQFDQTDTDERAYR